MKVVSTNNPEIEYGVDEFEVDASKVYFTLPLLSGGFNVFLYFNADYCGGWFSADQEIEI